MTDKITREDIAHPFAQIKLYINCVFFSRLFMTIDIPNIYTALSCV